MGGSAILQDRLEAADGRVTIFPIVAGHGGTCLSPVPRGRAGCSGVLCAVCEGRWQLVVVRRVVAGEEPFVVVLVAAALAERRRPVRVTRDSCATDSSGRGRRHSD